MHETILEEAIRLTSQVRQSDYGHPKFHFSCTANFITTYLRRKGTLNADQSIEPEDWPIFMMLDKISRSAERFKRDNLVDIAGYARTREMLEEDPVVKSYYICNTIGCKKAAKFSFFRHNSHQYYCEDHCIPHEDTRNEASEGGVAKE